MIAENLICTIEMFIFYGILYIAVPAVALHQFIKERSLGFRIVFYQMSALCYMNLVSFILCFLHIYYPVTTWLMFVIIPILAGHFFARKKVAKNFKTLKENCILRRSIKESARSKFKRFKEKVKIIPGKLYKNYFDGRILQLIAFIGIVVFIFAVIGYYHLHNYSYMCSDEPTHLYWINCLLNNEAFPAGLYPHGSHFMVAAMCSMFGLSHIRAWCCFGILASALITMAVFLTIRGLFKSKAAPIFAVIVFWVLNIFGNTAVAVYALDVYGRMQMGLPMEVGMYAYFILIYGMIAYVRDKKRSSLFLMSMAVAGTSFIHFYVTIFAVFTVLAFGIVFLIPLIKRKILFKMLIFGLIGVIGSVAPYGIGLLCGFSLEGSIYWGLSVMNFGNKVTSDDETEETTEAEETTENEISATTENVSYTVTEDGSLYGVSDTDIIADENESYDIDEETDTSESETTTSVSDNDKYTVIYHYNEDIGYYKLDTIEDIWSVLLKAIKAYVVQSDLWGICLYGVCVLSFLYGIIGLIISLIRKRDNTVRFLTYVFISVAWGLSFIVYIMPMLNMRSIIVVSRSGEFLAMLSMLLVAVPIQIIYDLFALTGIKDKYIDFVMSFAVMAGLGIYSCIGDIRDEHDLYTIFNMEEIDISTVEKLESTEEKNTWTVISTTNARMGILYHGYHYEIAELLRDISKNKDLYIPTQDIYVEVENNIPKMGYYHSDGSDYLDSVTPVSASDASQTLASIGILANNDIESSVYLSVSTRKVLSSKLYYWMEKIKEIYPDNVSVYAEDEFCTVYKIHQDPYFLLNLNVDYSDLVDEALELEQ